MLVEQGRCSCSKNCFVSPSENDALIVRATANKTTASLITETTATGAIRRAIIKFATLPLCVAVVGAYFCTVFLRGFQRYQRRTNGTRPQNRESSLLHSGSTLPSSSSGEGIRWNRDGGRPFKPEGLQVPKGRDSYPSFWDYDGPYLVSYDSRSMTINDERVLLLGGSMHPSRATKATWNDALDEAVQGGLNLITIYVMWSEHQPYPDHAIDWTFTGSAPLCDVGNGYLNSCTWDLAEAIVAAANRGLFVHIRLGPYDCAEYNYGGIPAWLPLNSPQMEMRRPNKEWLMAMETFLTAAVAYLTDHGLFAYQGGPIIMAQIENELGSELDAASDNLMLVDENGQLVARSNEQIESSLRNATMQDYADWCGNLAAKLAPSVVWTMCNGLSANNTINTYNGVFGDSSWLEQRGVTSEPALWTEDEGGFQIWGDEPTHPSDYFWGSKARSMAFDAMQWLARGGAHMNYYMFWGGYNRRRTSASGIMNMYASDAPMCPSGDRREPKFGHFEALHRVLADTAPILMNSPSALFKNESVEVMNAEGEWEWGDKQQMFMYGMTRDDARHEAIFIENLDESSHVVRTRSNVTGDIVLEIPSSSSALVVDGILRFVSSALDPSLTRYRRRIVESGLLLDWSTWYEPIGPSTSDGRTVIASYPLEQTELNLNATVDSDFAWYETNFSLDSDQQSLVVCIETTRSNAFLVYVDDSYVGAADTHDHKEGNVTIVVNVGSLTQGHHKLSLLSESLGYFNLIGRWGASTKAKLKGITGDVVLIAQEGNISLVDGRSWRSSPGLFGEAMLSSNEQQRQTMATAYVEEADWPLSPTWSLAQFDTPANQHSHYVRIQSGRGHLWLNGRDLGRYWNITRGGTTTYSQQYYFLPRDFLHSDGRLNELLIVDVFGGEHWGSKLVSSWIEATDEDYFLDEVDYPLACLE